MSEWNWVCKDEAFNDPECKWEIPFKRLDGEGNEIIISLEDVYPGHPECGQDLVMNIKPQHARLIAAAPDYHFWVKRLIAELPSKRDWLDPEIERGLKSAIAKAEPTPNPVAPEMH